MKNIKNKNIKKDFPIFSHTMNGKPLCYLDSASTTQKPQQVLDAMVHFYVHTNANISRGIYTLGEEATQAYEDARATVATFIGARSSAEVVFTSGATDSINRVAATWGMDYINAGDEIVLTELEHHANLLPWQRVAQAKGATLKFIPVLPDGSVDYIDLNSIITPKTKLVAIIHTSNAIGTHVDVARITARAREVGARVLLDASQSVAHQKINVQQLDCDFLAFSGHKLFGPTGVGVLYIKQELHDAVRPYAVGGGMVADVGWHDASWAKAPQKFEAGTPPIAQAVGLAAAIDYMQAHINFDELHTHEASLCAQLIEGLALIPRITVVGPVEQLKQNGHLVSFIVEGIHAHDVAFFLDSQGICVRAGHHCAQPLAHKLGYVSTVRASFHAYNSDLDVARLLEALWFIVNNV